MSWEICGVSVSRMRRVSARRARHSALDSLTNSSVCKCVFSDIPTQTPAWNRENTLDESFIQSLFVELWGFQFSFGNVSKQRATKKKVINSGIFISGFSFNLIGTMANKSHICGKLCIVFAFRQLLPYLAGSAIISSFAFVCVRSEFDGTKNPSVLHIFELCRGTANYQINLQSRKKKFFGRAISER